MRVVELTPGRPRFVLAPRRETSGSTPLTGRQCD
jgi:hypothetical protein